MEPISLKDLSPNKINEIEDLGFLPSALGKDQDRLFDQEDIRILRSIQYMLDLGFSLSDLEFYIDDLRKHLRNERIFWEKVTRKFSSKQDRKKIYQKLFNSTEELRRILYLKYGALEIGKLLGK